MSMNYHLDALLKELNPQRTQLVQKILHKFHEDFNQFPGAQTKHHNWEGGYRDHVGEVMNIAVLLFDCLNSKRTLPFLLEDALFVLFLHDLDKLLSYRKTENGFVRSMPSEVAQKKVFQIISEMNYQLSESEMNALTYVHGEGKDYHPEARIMNELAAFVHCCDVISARIWYHYGEDDQHW